ncbi:exosome complex protein Rrp4 [Candidatus Woesearchaeota archaeon]|nr:exosome complex protein Rrp4 [Candidatus Woesearchaeota archaeon]
MSNVLVKEKEIVVPGEALAEGMDYLPGSGTYRLNDKIIAKKLGLVNVSGRAIKLVPLSGRYLPKYGDKIIAQVTDITMNGWIVDINSAYSAFLSMRDASARFIRKGEDLTKIYDVGDYIRAKVIKVTSQNLVDLTMKEPGLNKLRSGRIIEINPHKVPRVIGKEGSMVSLIKTKTNCNIIVGQNGRVWINSENLDSELIAEKAIKKIEKEAHLEGLTERIEKFLDKSTGGSK